MGLECKVYVPDEEMLSAYLAVLRDTDERTAAVDTRENKVRDAANDNMTITDTKGTPVASAKLGIFNTMDRNFRTVTITCNFINICQKINLQSSIASSNAPSSLPWSILPFTRGSNTVAK